MGEDRASLSQRWKPRRDETARDSARHGHARRLASQATLPVGLLCVALMIERPRRGRDTCVLYGCQFESVGPCWRQDRRLERAVWTNGYELTTVETPSIFRVEDGSIISATQK